MPIIRLVFVSLFLTVFIHSHAFAEVVSSKGMAAVTYSGRKPTPSIIADAQSKAKVNAIERYIAIHSQSMMRNFEQIRTDVEGSVDSYLLGTLVVTEKTDKDAKRYSMVVRVDINVPKLHNALQDSSAVGNAAGHEKSYITFVFVSREQVEVTTYDDKLYRRKDSSVSEDGAEVQAASGAGVEFASESSRSETVTTGGSTKRKADKVEYDVHTTREINALMTGIFSTNGFKVVAADALEEGVLDVEAFKEDFRHGDDISSSTQRNAIDGVKSKKIPFLAMGTLDVGMRDTDPVSGLARVHVTVTGKIIDVSDLFPTTVASVSSVPYAGKGPNEAVARSNALKLAAESAAKELIEQLNAKGVQ
jgi:hypothetical protein